jgi:multidrug efflux pump subunit AcrB
MLLRPRKKSKGLLGRFFDWFNRTFEKVTGHYVSWSHVLIRRMGLAMALLIALSVVAGLMGKSLPKSFIPEEDQGYAFVQLQLPDAASLQRTDAVMRKMDEILAHTHGFRGTMRSEQPSSNTSASYTGFYFLQLDPRAPAMNCPRLGSCGFELEAKEIQRLLVALVASDSDWARPVASHLCCRIVPAEPSNSCLIT